MESTVGYSAWTVTESSRPIGHFDLQVTGHTARLGRVIVNPERRGRGLSHQAVRFAIECARAEGAERIELGVLPANTAAIRAYQTAGFASTGTRTMNGMLAMSAVIPRVAPTHCTIRMFPDWAHEWPLWEVENRAIQYTSTPDDGGLSDALRADLRDRYDEWATSTHPFENQPWQGSRSKSEWDAAVERSLNTFVARSGILPRFATKAPSESADDNAGEPRWCSRNSKRTG